MPARRTLLTGPPGACIRDRAIEAAKPDRPGLWIVPSRLAQMQVRKIEQVGEDEIAVEAHERTRVHRERQHQHPRLHHQLQLLNRGASGHKLSGDGESFELK